MLIVYYRWYFCWDFFFRTSADDGFPVVITELTFPSVTVESVPFTIHTGTSWAVVYCYEKLMLDLEDS